MGLSVPGRRRGLGAERLGHRGVGEPLVAFAHDIALLRGEPLALEQRLGAIACPRGEPLCAARLREPRQGVDQRPADALPRELGIDKQHVDLFGAFEAGEACDRAVDHSEQGQCLGQPGAESLFVISARGPGLALLFVVVIRGELIYARTKDLRAAPGVRREKGTKRDGAHRFASQLVVPSLLSLITKPNAKSSSRKRSDSSQSLAARAAVRRATILSI